MRWAALYPRHARPVKDVLDLLVAGVSEREILEDYPYLEPEDLRACLEFAAAQADHPILPIVSK